MENLDELIQMATKTSPKSKDEIMDAAKFCLTKRLFYSAASLIDRIETQFEVDATLREEINVFIKNFKAAVQERTGWPCELDGMVWLLIHMDQSENSE